MVIKIVTIFRVTKNCKLRYKSFNGEWKTLNSMKTSSKVKRDRKRVLPYQIQLNNKLLSNKVVVIESRRMTNKALSRMRVNLPS